MMLFTIAGLGIGAALIAFSLPRDQGGGRELLTPTTSYPAELVSGDAVGSESAPVVVELYSDFQCPACRLFVTERLGRLVTEFVRPGILRIEARDIAILGRGNPDESAALAAAASCAAEQGRYWAFHDYVFWNQGHENQGDHDAAFINRTAVAAGIEPTAMDRCVARPEVGAAVIANTRAALAHGITSTPTLIINGERVVGVPTYDRLAELIRRAAGSAPPWLAFAAPGLAAAPSPTSVQALP